MKTIDLATLGARASAAPTRGAPHETPPLGGPPVIAEIIAALRTVFDPEIPVNVYDLGLIYRIDASDGGAVDIDMTLTAPGCPVAGAMLDMVRMAVRLVEGVTVCNVSLVFDPPWERSRMSEETQLELGLL